jgi:dihydrofolate reductase
MTRCDPITPQGGHRLAASPTACATAPALPRMSKPALVLVAAVAANGVIGRGGRLPWRLKSDMAQFRSATLDKPVVMGRKTYLSIGKPLASRTNIVVSRDPAFSAAGVLVAPSIKAALTVAHADALRRGTEEIAVIGGADIFRDTLAIADRLLITRVELEPEGDTTFPAIDEEAWEEISRAEHPRGQGDDAAFTVSVYARKASHDAPHAGGKSAL